MRLWHWKLIPVLPRQQLLGQWRECCLIAKNIREKGSPNHILVNPVMEYPIEQFIYYSILVGGEMEDRGYTVKLGKFTQYFSEKSFMDAGDCAFAPLFPQWHTEKYLTQCLANLEEKHDRGGITDEEWNRILGYLSTMRRKERRTNG